MHTGTDTKELKIDFYKSALPLSKTSVGDVESCKSVAKTNYGRDISPSLLLFIGALQKVRHPRLRDKLGH